MLARSNYRAFPNGAPALAALVGAALLLSGLDAEDREFISMIRARLGRKQIAEFNGFA